MLERNCFNREMEPTVIWANALLSDGKILFWYTGRKCDSWMDFYKDFYYAKIDMCKYEQTHKIQLINIGFIDETEDSDYNQLCFNALAKDFYKCYKISPDCAGEKPY